MTDLNGILHVNAAYECADDWVFVELSSYDAWARVPREMANESSVIRCSYCLEPAVQLDHCWPYLIEATVCARHRETAPWRNRGKLRRAKAGHVALVPAADALELLEYVSALERELDAMRSAVATRAERRTDSE